MSIIAELARAAQAAVQTYRTKQHIGPTAPYVQSVTTFRDALLTVRIEVDGQRHFAAITVFSRAHCIAYIVLDHGEPDVLPCLAAELPLVLVAIAAAACGETILVIDRAA